MIINTGCRTGIPAYFSKWFYNRIKEGYVLVRNPYYPDQILRYKLTEDVADCLVFCTKNPYPMFERIKEISKFSQFWFVTITPYGKEIEPNVPDKDKVMESFKQLSEHVGIKGISWRYDPVFINDKYSIDFHLQSFEKMAKNLCGYADNCVISFIDLYVRTRQNFPEVREVSKEEQAVIGKAFTEIGREYGIRIRTCCEGTELEQYGIDISGCMTKSVIERAVGCELDVPKSRKSTRETCNCLLGNDIGMYNTCGHACVYCYANYNQEAVRQNMKHHNPESPFLIGGYMEGDTIKNAKQISYRNGQLSFDFT